ncbi:MAG: elongation factor 4 [Candidatus Omnitrophica bacterium CG1_02_44_16]|nr:MAG: elongation factor 4 [Candidatus Omnitrophica bacterium CG1_02_44_16]PIY83188.1 MAG: elongation factor 4 [Candidatus Omnitrophica bacterium CG_4_10_14_0_8_um_filter_44_12]PIZ83078.1 MAG: elongation factor 4 [Candidatus Omnitrophica bacterium CG_4_10_14_0_2_um_filter_44_9]
MNQQLIRNFSIIAHIDHGKSTLADRLIEFTGGIDKRRFHDQLLDDMEIEQERGITIKASSVVLNYTADDKNTYTLNLIDTPGHVDFTYEVSKSLAACEGALLIVDVTQGIEAQTVANFFLAREHNLKIIPVINKIDIQGIDIQRVKDQIRDILRLDEKDILLASAKESIGIKEILERVIKCLPAPKGNSDNPLEALIFDSQFDIYKGVILYCRLFNGTVAVGDAIKMMHIEKTYIVEEIGVFKPQMTETNKISCGEVGYITCNIKDPKEILIGDTVTHAANPAKEPLPGYKKVKPLVFCGVYPVNSKDFPDLKIAIGKLSLNDSSFVFETETSQSFGYGFRCGFLGLLHMEIIQERLEREYNLNLVLTTPNVVYRITTRDKNTIEIDNPAKLPDPAQIELAEEPFARVFMIIPTTSIEEICEMAKQRRGEFKANDYLGEDRVKVIYEMPLAEIIVDFYDKIKSVTRGYGSLDYEFEGYKPTKLVKLDILINGKVCDAFSCLIYKDKAQAKGRMLVEKLKELIPRQLFMINLQAAVGGNILASEKVRPMGKNVTAKCYGGDITRKRKLWEKQKEGKKRLKQVGNVEIPQEAFLAALKI